MRGLSAPRERKYETKREVEAETDPDIHEMQEMILSGRLGHDAQRRLREHLYRSSDHQQRIDQQLAQGADPHEYKNPTPLVIPTVHTTPVTRPTASQERKTFITPMDPLTERASMTIYRAQAPTYVTGVTQRGKSARGPLGRLGDQVMYERIENQADGPLPQIKGGLVPEARDLEDLPERAQRFLMSVPERWNEVIGAYPEWLDRIERDLYAAYHYPPRGAKRDYLRAVIADLTEMLDKEHSRLISSSRSRLRERALLKKERRSALHPVTTYDNIVEMVRPTYERGLRAVAPGYGVNEAGPHVDLTSAMPSGLELFARGQALKPPHVDYRTPAERLMQQEVVHEVVGAKRVQSKRHARQDAATEKHGRAGIRRYG